MTYHSKKTPQQLCFAKGIKIYLTPADNLKKPKLFYVTVERPNHPTRNSGYKLDEQGNLTSPGTKFPLQESHLKIHELYEFFTTPNLSNP